MNILRLLTVAILLLMSPSLWGQATTYTLITSTTDLVAGGKYLVVNRNTAGNGFALGYQNTNNRPQVAVTVVGTSITDTAATSNSQTGRPFEITLGGTTGAWTLYDAANNTYLRPAGSGNNNYLQGNASPSNYTITFSSGAAVMTNVGNPNPDDRNIIRHNNSASLFSSYASGQNAVYLYKAAACTAPTSQASGIIFPSTTTTSLGVSWTSGNGAGRVVIINTSNSFTAPTNGSNPTANLAYAGSGQQVVYNGTGSGPITVTGLNPSTTYWFHVYEYCGPNRVYQTANATGNPSSNQTLAPANSITTTAASFGPFCGGVVHNISVAYTSTGTFTGTFTAQLSDASGSFASPTVIGTGASPIAAVIPGTTAAGTGYRIRVVNDNPATVGGNNGSNIEIIATPTTPAITTPINACIGTSATITGTGSTGATGYTFWDAATAGSPITTSTTPAGTVSGSVLTTPSAAAVGQYTYYVQAENGSCHSARQTVVVNVNALPTVNLGNDTAYCSGTPFSLVLNAGNAGASYVWSDNSSAQTLTVTAAGTYSVTVTDANGCVGTGSRIITESAVPVVNLGNDTAYCAGSPFSLVLDASNAGATYLWSDNSTAQTLTVTAAGTYSVVVTGTNGCTASDSRIITESALPVVNLGNDTAYCAGTPLSLVLNAGNAGASYVWSDNSTAQTLTVTTAGTYSVTVTNINGCVGTGSRIITANTAPVVNLGTDVSYCVGDNFSAVLDAGNAGASYVWSTTATSQTITVTTAGTYSVTVTDVNGCVGTDSKTVTENALPIISLGNDTSYCVGTPFSLVLDAGNPGSQYLWDDNSQLQTRTVTTAGIYEVIVEDANGCLEYAEIIITENALPVVSLGNDTAFCAGSTLSLVLDAANIGSSYLWNNNSTAQTLTATAAGTYSVTVTDANGCIGTDSRIITENALPTVDLGNDTAFCAGSAFSLVLNAGNTGASYLWNNNTTAQTLTVTAAGTYSVTVTDANGCVGTDSKIITENALPVVDLGNDITTSATSQVLDAGAGFTSYAWTPGNQTTQQITVTQNGTYEVTVTNAAGCSASDEVTVWFTASLKELESAIALEVFPNPANEVLNVRMDYQGELQVTMISMSGQRLFTQQVTSYENNQVVSIDLSAFSNGMYVIQLVTKEFTVSKTVMVNK